MFIMMVWWCDVVVMMTLWAQGYMRILCSGIRSYSIRIVSMFIIIVMKLTSIWCTWAPTLHALICIDISFFVLIRSYAHPQTHQCSAYTEFVNLMKIYIYIRTGLTSRRTLTNARSPCKGLFRTQCPQHFRKKAMTVFSRSWPLCQCRSRHPVHVAQTGPDIFDVS